MYTLRKIEVSDYNKQYLKLLENLSIVQSHLITYELFEDFVKKLNDNHLIYVIEYSEKVIATGTIFIEHKLIHGLGKVGHIEDIVVDPEYGGNNFGKLIVTSLVEYAKEKNCYKVILDCNDKVCNFYKKCEFKTCGQQMSLYFE